MRRPYLDNLDSLIVFFFKWEIYLIYILIVVELTDLQTKGSKYRVEEIIYMKKTEAEYYFKSLCYHLPKKQYLSHAALCGKSMQNRYDSNHEGQHKVIIREEAEITTHHG